MFLLIQKRTVCAPFNFKIVHKNDKNVHRSNTTAERVKKQTKDNNSTSSPWLLDGVRVAAG